VSIFAATVVCCLDAGTNFGSPASWAQLASGDVCAKLAPAVAGAAVLWLVTHRVRSPWALPAALLVMPAVFFVVLYGPLRSNLPSARAAGWVTQSQVRAMLRACSASMRGTLAGAADLAAAAAINLWDGGMLCAEHAPQRTTLMTDKIVRVCQQADTAPDHFWDVWKLFNLKDGGILWSAMPRQLPTILALAFVVAFGSSLDVAAIQQDNPEELDYNRELTTAGAAYSIL